MNENETIKLLDNKIFVESNNLQIFKELMEDSFKKSILNHLQFLGLMLVLMNSLDQEQIL